MNGTAAVRDHLAALRRWWLVVVITTIVGALAAFVLAPKPAGGEPTDAATDQEEELFDPSQGPFQATHLLVRSRVHPFSENLQLVQLLASQGEVPVLVADALGRPEDALAVSGATTVIVDSGLATVSVQALQATPTAAEELATTYADTLVAYLDERASARTAQDLAAAQVRLEQIETDVVELEARRDEDAPAGEQRLFQAELDSLVSEFTALNARVRDLEDDLGEESPSFVTLQDPIAVPAGADVTAEDLVLTPVDQAPSRATWLGVAIRTVLGGLLGMALGLAIVVLLHRLDPYLRRTEHAELHFGLPVVAVLPRERSDELVLDALDTAVAHAGLASSLRVAPAWQLGAAAPTADVGQGAVVGTADELQPLGRGLRTVLVTAAEPGAGTTTTAVNLARAYADAGLHVLLVDCAFTAPRLQELVVQGGEPPALGLRELSGAVHLVGDLRRRSTIDRVSVIQAGVAGPAPAWLLTAGHDLVTALGDLAEVVVIDSGPVTHGNEAASLVGAVDEVLLVAQLDHTRHRAARETTERLARLHAVVAGVAVVGGRRVGDGSVAVPTAVPALELVPTASEAAEVGDEGAGADVADDRDGPGPPERPPADPPGSVPPPAPASTPADPLDLPPPGSVSTPTQGSNGRRRSLWRREADPADEQSAGRR